MKISFYEIDSSYIEYISLFENRDRKIIADKYCLNFNLLEEKCREYEIF